MPGKPLVAPRPRLLAADQLERIHEAAARILAELGLAVGVAAARESAQRAGMRVEGDRVFPDRAAFDDFVAQTRADGGHAGTAAEPESEIELTVCQYANHVHDVESDEILPLTTERLVDAAKFVDAMAASGVIGAAPGTPVDVPAELQPILQYKIGAEHCRHGRRPTDVRFPRSLPYVMEMAEALGRRYRVHPIYVASPLTLAGDSFECARMWRDRLEGVSVSNMSSLGGTAPIRLGDALALAVAEVVGAGIVVREAIGLPVWWSIRVCSFDPRAMALSLGAPEDVLVEWACQEVMAFYRGVPLGAPVGGLHSQAKVPDAQAAAERMASMAVDALFGARTFSGGGRLSLDEVFSAEQLVIDCEIRDHVQRLMASADGGCDPASALEEARAGLQGGFLGLETTARAYRSQYWLPELFERRSLSGWRSAGMPELRRRAKDVVRRKSAAHDYELEPDVRRELDRIYTKARRELSD